MREKTPAAFRHVENDSMLQKITAGVHEIHDVEEAMDRVFANIAVVLKDIQVQAEKAGHVPEVAMDEIDNLREVLIHRCHMITAAIIMDTELDEEA